MKTTTDENESNKYQIKSSIIHNGDRAGSDSNMLNRSVRLTGNHLTDLRIG